MFQILLFLTLLFFEKKRANEHNLDGVLNLDRVAHGVGQLDGQVAEDDLFDIERDEVVVVGQLLGEISLEAARAAGKMIFLYFLKILKNYIL
jgi:uncharacterized metal-binding protein YceD (DUF177 family)